MRRYVCSPELLQEIKSRIDLPCLIRKYTTLNGKNKGICPFHNDHAPSLSVDSDKGLWHCFGCGRGGDEIAFIMEAEHLTFPNAVKFLAFEVGIRLPESETINQTLTEKWEERKKKTDELDYDEELFKELENACYDCLRYEMQYLPPKEKRHAKDYTREFVIEQEFDELDALVKKRELFFSDIRKKVRCG